MNNVLSYSKLMSEQNSLEAIRKGARVICERRGRYADTISKDVERIKSEISVIESLIKTIEENSSVLDSNQESDLKSLCEQLKKSLKAYLQKAQSLCNRFNNKKIKVLAFGLKSEGKSTFTRRYTGLPESVVAVKADGDDKDKTGALSVIFHDKNYTKEDPKIIVHFKTQEEILAVVNFCVRKLGVLPNFKLPNCTDSGYLRWSDLESVLKDSTEKQKAYQTLTSLTDGKEVVDFTALKSFLLSVFEKESNFVDVKPETHFERIYLPKLPLYNDMTNEGEKRYLSVDRIEIFANLEYEGIFENFEICDTKGISATAGGAMIVEQALYNDINNSDAVFSIKKVGQNMRSVDFYSDLNNNIIKCVEGVKPERLDNKHFAIFNLLELADKDTIDQTINTINELKLAKCIYLGSLGDNVSYNGEIINADLFAQSVIVNMLSKIVDSTRESDDLLITDCNKLVKEIIDKQTSLIENLKKIQKDYDDFSIEKILPQSIEELRLITVELLKEEAKAQNISLLDAIDEVDGNTRTNERIDDNDDDDDDDDDITYNSSIVNKPIEQLKTKVNSDNSQMNFSIFKMITGTSDEDCKEYFKKCKGQLSASDVAIEYIIDNKVKEKAGENVIMHGLKVTGTISTLGGYIDSVSSLLYSEIEENVNDHSLSHEIDSIVSMRKSVYQKVWNSLKLNELIGCFNEENLNKYISNDIIKKWFKFYKSQINDQRGSVILPQQSYNILIAYFKDMSYDNKSNEKTGSVVDWKKLTKAIQHVYRIYDFEGRITEKLANEELLKHNVVRELYASLTNPNFICDIKDLYLGHKADTLLKYEIISKDQYDRISNKEKWSNLCNAREQLSIKSVTSLQDIK